MGERPDVGRALTAHSVISSREEDDREVSSPTNGKCYGLDGPCLPVVRVLEAFTLDCVEEVVCSRGGAY